MNLVGRPLSTNPVLGYARHFNMQIITHLGLCGLCIYHKMRPPWWMASFHYPILLIYCQYWLSSKFCPRGYATASFLGRQVGDTDFQPESKRFRPCHSSINSKVLRDGGCVAYDGSRATEWTARSDYMITVAWNPTQQRRTSDAFKLLTPKLHKISDQKNQILKILWLCIIFILAAETLI